MNTRIQELAEQAKNQVPKGILAPNLWIEQYNRIFAELIVRECSQFVEDKFDFCGDELIIAEQILKHFGVDQ